ncbi:MAG: carboxypeptidase regulatory-like domain-containing protein [Phycisphaerae bacterium]
MTHNMIHFTIIALCAIGFDSHRTASGFSGVDGRVALIPCAVQDGAPPQSMPSLTIEYVDQPASSSRRRARRRRMPGYKVAPVKNGGTLVGTVLFNGQSPDARKIDIVKDHEVCGKRKTKVSLIQSDEKGRVAEAVVYLADIKQGRGFIRPRKKPPVINQHQCTFVPHVQAVRIKEDVEILNSDTVAHNINATQRIYTLFNILQPQKEMRATKQFKKPGLISLRCNVHAWMQGWLWVFRHPYYQVTGSDGAFRLEDIPVGKYELAVWQEHLGVQYFSVDVKAGETVTVPVELMEKQNGGKRQNVKTSK